MEYRRASWRANRVDLHCNRDAGIMESHLICSTIEGNRILRIALRSFGLQEHELPSADYRVTVRQCSDARLVRASPH